MTFEETAPELKHLAPRKQTLGTIHLRNNDTGDVILVPTPSNDPNDPLNW